MTTVAALARDDQVWMAADSYQTAFGVPVPGTARKIRRYRSDSAELLLGISGSGALATMLDADLDLPELGTPNPDDLEPWVGRLVRKVTALAKAGDVDEWGVLLGFRGRLWTLRANQPILHPDGVAGIGSGSDTAVGAADVLLEHSDLPPEKLILRAVEIGVHRDHNSAGPIQVEHLPAREE